jgi:LacI family gluconate utilization system Gnt-I transcriptional repressor
MTTTDRPPTQRRVRPRSGRVRLDDVAEAAGVSTATASRALRRPELVNEDTRSRIAAAIKRLGYIPDLAAGGLASDRTGQVAVVVPSLGTPAFIDTIRGISDTLRPLGLQIVLGDTNLSGDNEAALIASLLGRRADAVILTDVAQSPASRAMLSRARIPVVETWSLTASPIDMNVGFDNRAAGRAVTEHLIATGRRCIGMICGALRMNRRGRDRRLGFLDAMRAAGLDDSLIVELPFPVRFRDAAEALAELVARAPGLDGVFCSGDSFAAGALFGAQRHGWAVPARIAIAGLGDLEMTEQLVPALSGARIPGYRMGQIAAGMVIRRLRGEAVADPIVDVGFEIVVRESSAPPPAVTGARRKIASAV